MKLEHQELFLVMTHVKLHEAGEDTLAASSALLDLVQEAHLVVAALKQKMFVVKLGGSTLENQQTVLKDLIWLHDLGVKVVLVHGGGPVITAWLEKLHISTRFEHGMRVTDAQTLEVVQMVLCGQINKQLVSLASEMGGNAIGLCGTDSHMVQAHIANERLGLVGEIEKVDVSLLVHLTDLGYLPIVASLGLGPDGGCLNINADMVAAHLAGALKAERLIFLSDVNGVRLADGAHLSELNAARARALVDEGVIHGGMIPKITACLDALTSVPRVHIVNGSTPHVLLSELEAHPHIGTTITR